MPKSPYPDPDPHFNPKPNYGPGSDTMSADFMGGGAYNNPNFGLPSDGGGSFIGLGRFDSACNIPNDMQPSTPSGGLFGPDFGIGLWGMPVYDPDWRHVPGGWIYTPDLPTMPLYFFPDDLGMLELPSVSVGARPSMSFSDIGKSKVIAYSEVKQKLYGDLPVFYMKIEVVRPPKQEPEKEPEKEEEKEEKKKGFWERLLEGLKNAGRAVANYVRGVLGMVNDLINTGRETLDHLGRTFSTALRQVSGLLLGQIQIWTKLRKAVRKDLHSSGDAEELKALAGFY
jgi:hypothetical protein